jgi:hypothetical protein
MAKASQAPATIEGATQEAGESDQTFAERTGPSELQSPAEPSAASLAIADANKGFIVVGGMKLTVKRRVAMPVLPFADNMTIIIKFATAIKAGKEIKEGARGKPKMGVAMIAEIESTTGEHRTLICGEVLQRELAENYPDHAYVGCWFQITKIAPRGERQYATYVIDELDAPTGEVA